MKRELIELGLLLSRISLAMNCAPYVGKGFIAHIESKCPACQLHKAMTRLSELTKKAPVEPEDGCRFHGSPEPKDPRLLFKECLDRTSQALEESIKALASEESDTMRLEWLARSGAHIAYSKDGDCCWLHWAYDGSDDVRKSKNQLGIFDSFREAIDTEMLRSER